MSQQSEKNKACNRLVKILAVGVVSGVSAQAAMINVATVSSTAVFPAVIKEVPIQSASKASNSIAALDSSTSGALTAATLTMPLMLSDLVISAS